MTATYYVGDALEVMGKLPEQSVDLVLTSPPFLALRSYLPADHPDKALEGGSQPTPGAYIDWLIDVVEACDRVLAPHGSLCFELGDTYAGSTADGGDNRGNERYPAGRSFYVGQRPTKQGWPLAKSLSLIPELFRFSLVYGQNPLTGRQTERWRLRNVVRWVRPNPPVGALGDKFRPATSELMVFCKSSRRFFDLDAVREPSGNNGFGGQREFDRDPAKARKGTEPTGNNPAGAPPLDWWNIPLLEGEEATPYGPKEPTKDSGVRRKPVSLAANPSRGDYGDGVGELMGGSNPLGAPPLDWWNIPPGGYSGTTMWTERKRVDPRESVGDIQRTTSADCPVHAGSLVPAAKASHGEQQSEDQSPHNPDNGDRPALKPTSDSVPIAQQPALNLEDGSSDWSDPPYVPAATRRSRASSKTAPAPVTTIVDKPSDRTLDRTDGRSTKRQSVVQHPDIPENRTSGVCLDGCTPESCSHSFDRSSEPFDEACTCSYWALEAKSTSHYAVWPPELLIKPIKAMCPEKVCRVCGEPSRRVVEREQLWADGSPKDEWAPFTRGATGRPSVAVQHGSSSTRTRVVTESWTDCGHDDFRVGRVLDPFAGSGTTLLVATGHGRDAIGIDLDERNWDLSLERVGPFLLERGEL